MKKAHLLLPFLVGLILYGCSPPPYDLAIRDVRIFDAHQNEVLLHKTILIKGDHIAAIVNADELHRAVKSIEGKDRLLTSGFIDSHIHLTDMFGDYDRAPAYLLPDSLDVYENRMKRTYLIHGTTTIADMGQPEKWLEVSLNWQKNPSPSRPNLFNTGGAIISDEERTPYISHTEVINAQAAIEKMATYESLGLTHIKLYWRLRKDDMKIIVEEAKKRGLSIYGHIDQNVVSIQYAIDLGVKHFEHFLTLPASVLNYQQHNQSLRRKYQLSFPRTTDEYLAMLMFYFDYIANDPVLRSEFEALIDKMAKSGCSLSTTIHPLGSIAGETYFFTSMAPPSQVEALTLSYTSRQKQQLRQAYVMMMKMLKYVHDKGVKVRIGTDCREGGKALLSELLLLYEAGFSIGEILQIATINGGDALKIDDQYGTIEVGKKADLILFHQNPFNDYKHFLGEKTIIKGGQVVK
ncbi:MAG: amidohydrolase family protein [Bacteroidota bacterium]